MSTSKILARAARDLIAGKVGTAEQLRKLRDGAELTLDGMSSALRVSKRTYQDWEAGRVEIEPAYWLAAQLICANAKPAKK